VLVPGMSGCLISAVIGDVRGKSSLIPMVQKWAWIWSAKGPVRLDVEGAILDAIRKVAPKYFCYDTA